MPDFVTTRKRRRRARGDDECDDESVERIGNCVFFYSDVSCASMVRLYVALDEARRASTESDGRIYLYVQSGGGDLLAGLAGMAYLRSFERPITTIADAFVASAATLLFLGGHTRLAAKHAHMLIHQLSMPYGGGGKHSELQDEAKNSTTLMRTMAAVYRERTSIDPKTLKRLLSHEESIDAPRCLELGIVHELY